MRNPPRIFKKYSDSNPAYRVRPSLRFCFSSPAHTIALFFGAGVMRPGPGSWGSLAAALSFFCFEGLLPAAWLLLPGAAAFFCGVWAAGRTGEDLGVQDAGAIVIDEVAAVWLLLAVLPAGIFWTLAGFLAFRVFDIVKLPPASGIDRRMHSGLGVMLDDVFAALWALAALQALSWLGWGEFCLRWTASG